MIPIYSSKQKIDDIEMYLEIYGKGELAQNFNNNFVSGKFVSENDRVIIMLHGNGESTDLFSENVEALCENNYCILIDSRGHGKTSVGTSDFTIDLMSEDLSKLCDVLNIGKFKLLGFSDGGNIALTYAVRHPERLSHLAISGANLNPGGLKFFTKLSITTRCFFARLKKDKSKEDNLKFQLLNLMAGYPHISPRLLKNIDCKVIVLEGKNDVIKHSHTELIAISIRNSKLFVVPNSGHNVFKDNTKFVNDLLSDFLAHHYKEEN